MSDSKKAAVEKAEKKKTAAEKKEELKQVEGIQVIHEDDKLRVVDGDKFVEGWAEMLYEEVCQIEDMSMPSKTTLNNKNEDITIYNDEKNKTNTKTNLYILSHCLTDWSAKKDISYDNLRKVRGYSKLFKEYITEVKKLNGLLKDKDEEEKKSE